MIPRFSRFSRSFPPFKTLSLLPAIRLAGCFIATLLLCTTGPSLWATEFFVAKDGDDQNDGRTAETAFATLQRGVDALEPGDVLTIAPGEYFETVRRTGLGSTEAETVIRAAIPGTAIVRGDRQAPTWEQVEGSRFIHSGSAQKKPQAILEHDTLRILAAVPEAAEVETSPGSFFFDEGSSRLTMSPSNLRPPQDRHYTVTVLEGSGLFLEKPVRVVVDGLVFTGFAGTAGGWNVLRNRGWGVALEEPTDCVVRNVTGFFNQGGIGILNGSGNVVDGCLAFGNKTHNILVYGGDNNRDNVIENSRAYRSASGMHFYHRMHGPGTLRNNIAWSHDLDFSNKTGLSANEFKRVERCIGLGDFQAHNLQQSIMGGVNEYDRRLEAPENNILFRREADLDLEAEFADPWNLDFRLQGNSRFRGKDGQPDRGPFPFGEDVFFVGPDGSEENDGLSVATAKHSLTEALDGLRPGDTLYLLGGVYDGDLSINLAGAADDPIRIRGRGQDNVVLRGTLDLGHSEAVEFERITFDGTVRGGATRDLTFRNCIFTGKTGGLQVSEAEVLRIEHCFFAGTTLRLVSGTGVWLQGNLHAPNSGAAVMVGGKVDFQFSDYNAFDEGKGVWEIDGTQLTLMEVQATGREIHSRQEIVEWSLDDGLPQLGNADAIAGWGPLSRPYGPFALRDEPGLAVAGPFVHRAHATSADLEWWFSSPSGIELSWGTAGEEEQSVRLPPAFQFGGYSLTGLQPDTEYTVRLRAVEAEGESEESLTFRTANEDPTPRTYFVAVDGSDSADGKSAQSAFATIAQAATVAGPGDTVVVGGGEYPETVWVRGTGVAGRPVTFRSAPGEKVSIGTFRLSGKEHVRIDGFYTNGEMRLIGCGDIQVTRCFSRGPLLRTDNSRDVLVKNCVSTSGYPFRGVGVTNSPRFHLENSVIVNPAIYGALVQNQSDQPVILRNNIFTDSYASKAAVQYFEVARAESLELENNCFYMRLPDEDKEMPVRHLFLLYDDEAYDRGAGHFAGLESSTKQPSKIEELTRMTLDEFHGAFGDTGSFAADPQFRGAEGLEIPEGGRFTEAFHRGNRAYIGFRILSSDLLVGSGDFNDFFATNPEFVEKGIGLVPEDFADFHFNQPE